MNIPARQSERNEAFTRAVWAGDAKTAAALAGTAGRREGRHGMREARTMAYDDEARERDRRALAWWSAPALYGPCGWTAHDAEIARESLRRRLARPVRKNPGMFPLAGEDFAIGANPGTG